MAARPAIDRRRRRLASDSRPEVGQLDSPADRVKFHLHSHAAADIGRVAADQAADHLEALVEVDDDRRIRNAEGWRLRPPHHGPAVDLAGTSAPLPPELCAPAETAHRG